MEMEPTLFEEFLIEAAYWIQLGLEAVAIAFIAGGVLFALMVALGSRLPAPIPPRDRYGLYDIRLVVSKFLILGLEFLLAADVVATVLDPSWNELGRLGAVAGIRTFLNFFLERDIRETRREMQRIEPRDTVGNQEETD